MRGQLQHCCPLCSHTVGNNGISAHGRSYLTCTECRLVFMHPSLRPSPTDERNRYELHQNDPQDSGYREHLLRAITPLTKVLPRGSGIDFGCGPVPAATLLLRNLGYSVESYDPFFAPDEKLLQHEYDFAVCIEAAEHFFWPAKEFQSLHRLLRPGGWLALMTRLLTGDQPLQSWWYAKDPTHVSLYSRASLDWIEKRWGWCLRSSSEEIHLFQKIESPDCLQVSDGSSK